MNELRHQDKKTFLCKSLKMFEYLCVCGFSPSVKVPNVENPTLNNWVFENSPDLEIAIKNFFEALNGQKKQYELEIQASKDNTYRCRRSRELEYLVGQGFIPVRIVEDISNPNYKNWIFVVTNELKVALDNYFSR